MAELVAAIGQQGFQLQQATVGVTLQIWCCGLFAEFGQFGLGLADYLRCSLDLLLQAEQILLALGDAFKVLQGTFQHRLQCLLLSLWQLALGQSVQALLDIVDLGQWAV